MPRNDMPTFRIDSKALSGVDAVVGNALMSTRWVDATTNLAKSVEMTARFVGNAADRDGEGFDYLKELIQNVRVNSACPGSTRLSTGSRSAKNAGSTASPAPARTASYWAVMLVLRNAKRSGWCSASRNCSSLVNSRSST